MSSQRFCNPFAPLEARNNSLMNCTSSRLLGALALLLALSVSGASYAQSTDFEALFTPELGSVIKEESLVYAVSLDLSPIYQELSPPKSSLEFIKTHVRERGSEERLTLAQSDNLNFRSLENSLIESLGRWPNLSVVSPERYRSRLVKSSHRQRLVKLAYQFIREAEVAYKDVDLDRTRALLDSAIELLSQSKYSLLKPVEVAQLYLKRGIVAIEKRQVLSASLDFRRALLLGPKLRLKSGFDSPMAVKVFNETLKQLQELDSRELVKLAELREWIDDRSPTLIIIKVQDKVFSALWGSPGTPRGSLQHGVVRDQESLQIELTYQESMDKLASRIWLNLPITSMRLSNAIAKDSWELFAGWVVSTPLKAPVEIITQPGLLLEIVVKVLTQLEVKSGLSLAQNSRDQAQDLTRSFPISSIYMGPLWSKTNRRWWLSFGVMLEGSYLGSTSITRIVGCKYFDLSSDIPQEICNPRRDIRQIKGSWRLGPRIQMNAGVNVARSWKVAIQLNSSISFYQSSEHPFEYPVGAGLLIGYSFNSH